MQRVVKIEPHNILVFQIAQTKKAGQFRSPAFSKYFEKAFKLIEHLIAWLDAA